MNEFEEIIAVRNVIRLLRERGIERTEADVRRRAATYRRKFGFSAGEAYEALEGELLDRKPHPEEWE